MKIKEIKAPSILIEEHEKKHNPELLGRGDVVVYKYDDWAGIMVLDSEKRFVAASDFSGHDVWYFDDIPEGTELYEPTDEEQQWGVMKFFTTMYCGEEWQTANPLTTFLANECPTKDYGMDQYWQRSLCFAVLRVLPHYIAEESKDELWKSVVDGLQDTGLEFNRFRTEMYCYLHAVLMVCKSVDDAYTRKRRIAEMTNNWGHFSWMYGMALGRIIGNAFNTFTAEVNQLHTDYRSPYLHLYLPLVEANVEKIYKLNKVEKEWKLRTAIDKMRLKMEQSEQHNDLDNLYKMLFPKHFQKMMAEYRPLASIKELKEELTAKSERIAELEATAAVSEYLARYNELLQDFRELAANSVTYEELGQLILQLSTPQAEQVVADLCITLYEKKAWMEQMPKILKAIREKKNERMVPAEALEQSQNMVEELAKRPTVGTMILEQNNHYGELSRNKNLTIELTNDD